MILVDGYNGGVAHITADQIRDHNIGMYGNGDYVLSVGDQFSYEIVDNNTVKLSSGMIVMCGARAVTGYGKTETLVIENGTSGYKRSDIIVAEYSKDNESLIESVSVKVVKGTLGTSYSDPALVQGNIRAGATKRQAALYRVKINGLSIEAVEKMWTAADPLNGITVPISKGGTGKTAAAEALEALGGISWTKIWENANTTSAFPNQKISLDLSDYDYVAIVGNTDKGSNARMVPPIITKVGMGGIYQNGAVVTGTYAPYRRYFMTDATGVNFDAVYPSSGMDNNIPCFIFGIKGVI